MFNKIPRYIYEIESNYYMACRHICISFDCADFLVIF